MENELRPELLAMHSLNFAAMHNSSSRSVMFASHASQRLVIKGLEKKRVQTGIEQEFGKYTFSVKMPANGRVIKIIQRYPEGVGQDSLKFNPETIVIYENDETKEIDCFSIPYHASYHQFFGYRYDIKNTINQLKPGNYIAKDTIFANSPGVADNTNYMYGTNLKSAFMSIPSVSEDGVMICEDVLDKLKTRIFETRVVEFGAGHFPLNLYGTSEHYKPFPDIGDNIREDGVLMMMRPYDNDLSPVDMSVFDTMEPDYVFDKATYVRGGNGRVVDIKVVRNNNPNKNLPEGLSAQADKYANALIKFHQEIIHTEEQLRYERKRKYGETKLKLSPKFHRLIVESLSIINHNQAKLKQNLGLLYRKAPIDEYRIEFTVEYEITPGIGYKLSDIHGGKGVICAIKPRSQMPVDSDGNSADVVFGAESTANRMNIGRLYEHYVNSSIVTVEKRIRDKLGIHGKTSIEVLETMDAVLFNHAYNDLLHYYSLISQPQYEFFSSKVTAEERYQHMADILNDGIYIFSPINNEKDFVDMVLNVENYCSPTYGPVQYVGDSGNLVTTVEKVRIAPMYIILLDKITDDWSSVSSGKLQHFGVLSPPTKSEKFMFPFRNSPVRTIGETEGRIFAGYCGREAIAEMMDRSNSPTTQRNMVWNILNAEDPTNIDRIVDREAVPLGGSRPIALVKHILSCSGIRPVYVPEDASEG